MDRNAVKSSNIKSVGYDPLNVTLEIEFKNGGVYQYSGFTADKYEDFINSPSLGRWFAAEIRGKYPMQKMPQEASGETENEVQGKPSSGE